MNYSIGNAIKPAQTTEPKWYRQFWPWFLIVLPSIAVIASISSLVIATRYSDSALRDDYSKQGFAIQATDTADTKARQQRLGAALTIGADGIIDVDLHGESIARTDALMLEFIHPFDKQHDIRIALESAANGHYRGHLSHTLEGRWSIELRQPQQSWRLRAGIDLPTLKESQPFRELHVSL